MKSFIVLGGGTAGLIAAITLKQTYPNYSVKVIESDSIGIIGVGEGSTEHWRRWLDYCELDLRELVRETDATLKTGIKFDNWNGDGKNYFHSLGDLWYPYNKPVNTNTFLKSLHINGIKTEDALLDTGLVPMHQGLVLVNQYHFNTFKLNTYLHDQCIKKGIEIVKDTISDVVLNNTGDVDYLVGDLGEHKADFFIDSSGFKRVIASKLGAKFISYKKYLPMNHAIAFPTESVAELKPYTLSRALSSGWNWRIPTQSRFGNGYVFCDEFINPTEAYDEVQSIYSEEVKVAKDIKFEAGRVDNFWINNCLSIGLSASFVEPLEASSIGNSILQSFTFCDMIEDWFIDKNVSKSYNKHYIECFDNIVDFVQLHYIVKRDDSEFWRALPSMIEHTDFVKEHLEHFKKNMPSQHYFTARYGMFNASNWAQVLAGLELYDKEYMKNKLIEAHGESIVPEKILEFEKYLKQLEEFSYIEHKTLLSQNRIVVKFDRK